MLAVNLNDEEYTRLTQVEFSCDIVQREAEVKGRSITRLSELGNNSS